jgi:hypothetical protein
MVFPIKTINSKDQFFEAPSDWTIHIVYNIGYNVGQVSIESYVVDYTEKDLENLNTIWKPTDTKYVSKEEI